MQHATSLLIRPRPPSIPCHPSVWLCRQIIAPLVDGWPTGLRSSWFSWSSVVLKQVAEQISQRHNLTATHFHAFPCCFCCNVCKRFVSIVCNFMLTTRVSDAIVTLFNYAQLHAVSGLVINLRPTQPGHPSCVGAKNTGDGVGHCLGEETASSA